MHSFGYLDKNSNVLIFFNKGIKFLLGTMLSAIAITVYLKISISLSPLSPFSQISQQTDYRENRSKVSKKFLSAASPSFILKHFKYIPIIPAPSDSLQAFVA